MLQISIKPQRFFLFAAIFWGLINIVLTPPFLVPDEPAHFFKALHLSNGNFFPRVSNNHVGDYFQKGSEFVLVPFDSLFHETGKRFTFSDLEKAFNIRFDPKAKSFNQFPNTARLFPVPYFPQVLGISAAKLLFQSPLCWLYLGRLLNLFTWICLVFLAIKNIPLHKWTLVLTALLPMHINLASSLSADTFTNAIAFLGISLFLKISLQTGFVSRKEVVWLMLVFLLIALSKNVYVIFGMLLLLIPASKFHTRKPYFNTLLLAAMVGLAGFLAGSIYTSRVYALTDPGVPFFHHLSSNLDSVDHNKQMNFIAENPWKYFAIMSISLWNQLDALVYSGIGVLGWLDVVLPFWYYVFMIFALPSVALCEGSTQSFLNLKSKMLIFFVVALTVILVFTISYLTWTPVGKPTIDGLQGRYFIPVLPLFLLLFSNQIIKVHEKWPAIISIFITTISFSVSTYVLYQRYWEIF